MVSVRHRVWGDDSDLTLPSATAATEIAVSVPRRMLSVARTGSIRGRSALLVTCGLLRALMMDVMSSLRGPTSKASQLAPASAPRRDALGRPPSGAE